MITITIHTDYNYIKLSQVEEDLGSAIKGIADVWDLLWPEQHKLKHDAMIYYIYNVLDKKE